MSVDEKTAVGLRVYTKIRRAPAEDMQRLISASVSDIADVLRGAGVMDSEIAPVYAPMRRIFGPAITVDLTPGDGLLLRAAIDAASAGDVVVANAHGATSRAILGGTIAMHMVHRGIQGLIVDGGVRDVGEFRALDFPVMASAVTPRSGTTDSGYGEVNVPIACGRCVVHPGDLVVGDEEGIVVVPRHAISAVGRGLGRAGHPLFEPDKIRDRLKELAPDAPVLGVERARAAITRKDGAVIDGTYEDDVVTRLGER